MTDVYDPDAPPEREAWEFIGVLTDSKQVNNADEADACGVGENYRKYMEQAKRGLDTPVWFLRARGLDIKREDGTDYIATDIISLQDKSGRWLSKGQTPDQVATAFRGLGFTAAPSSVGAPNSAVGQAFQFKETDLTLGRKGFTKRVSLLPTAHVADPSTVSVVKTVAVQGSSASPEAPPDASPEATALVAKTLDGTTRANMLNAILQQPAVKGIARVLGHDLIAAATDETLADLLITAGYLVEQEGVLRFSQTAVPA